MSSLKLAIDIGTTKTSVFQVGAGVILCEPSLVSVSGGGKKTSYEIGLDAKRMLGKSAISTTVISPVSEGEIRDLSAAKIMLEKFLSKIEVNRFTRVEVCATVPCGTEKAAISRFKELFSACGINNVNFIESPIAAAVGAGAPISESAPCFIIDMGGGVTNIAAVSLDGVIAGVSANLGGNLIDGMIIDSIEDRKSLRIGSQTAEQIKCEIGSLLPGDTMPMVISGMDISSGAPRSVRITAADVYEPIRYFVNKIYEISSMLLAKLPPEVSAEIRNTGIYLGGGLSRIVGLEEYFYNEFSLAVNVTEDPEFVSVLGAGKIMQNDKVYKKLRI